MQMTDQSENETVLMQLLLEQTEQALGIESQAVAEVLEKYASLLRRQKLRLLDAANMVAIGPISKERCFATDAVYASLGFKEDPEIKLLPCQFRLAITRYVETGSVDQNPLSEQFTALGINPIDFAAVDVEQSGAIASA